MTKKAGLGLSQTGGQQIELVQPDLSLPSTLCRIGSEEVPRGATSTGNEFLYMSGQNAIPYVEFVDPNKSMAAFFSQIADAAVFWDGTRPIYSSR